MKGKRAEIVIETREVTIVRKTNSRAYARYCSNCGHPVDGEHSNVQSVIEPSVDDSVRTAIADGRSESDCAG